jgi:uncharacterized protein with NAD-binding domain and iron-sulfur cluster
VGRECIISIASEGTSRIPEKQKVIIIGGGVAGMTAAHELATRGFAVVVYELRNVPGGKARSIRNPSDKPAEHGLPGEHGFRFFPGFYRHIPDTMKRIPLGDGRTVFDNLTQSIRIGLARNGEPTVVSPAQFPRSPQELCLALNATRIYAMDLDIPVGDRMHFAELLVRLLSSCERRRFDEYENESWWDFSGAASRSAAYGKYMADGLTRTLVAARAKEMSARTGGYILLQLLQDMMQPGMQVDRVLNAPTNDAWIGPWLTHLKGLGVEYRFCHRVTAIRSNGNRVTGVAGRRVPWPDPDQTDGEPFEDDAQFYVAAVPVEVMQSEIEIPLKGSVPGLGKLDKLVYRWMNGIVFYLKQDVPLVRGHMIFIDSAWSLTAISQAQFWPGVDIRQMGDGSVSGILSVDISDWETAGCYAARGRPAKECPSDVIAEEVWAQLKTSLNVSSDVLRDEDRVGWFLDQDIVSPNPAGTDTNLEPLLVNVKGSWQDRPDAALPEVSNLFLAADYVRTYTDLATMEGANEAARRAVNAILASWAGRSASPEWWTAWSIADREGTPASPPRPLQTGPAAEYQDRAGSLLYAVEIMAPTDGRLAISDGLRFATAVPEAPIADAAVIRWRSARVFGLAGQTTGHSPDDKRRADVRNHRVLADRRAGQGATKPPRPRETNATSIATEYEQQADRPRPLHERLFGESNLHAAPDGPRILRTILLERLRLLLRGRRRRVATRGPAWLPARRRGRAVTSARGLAAESD